MNGNVLGAVQTFYDDVRVDRDEGEWFDLKVSLGEGCVMSLSFNIFINGVMREANEKLMESSACL